MSRLKPWKLMTAKVLSESTSTPCCLRTGMRWTCTNGAHISPRGAAAWWPRELSDERLYATWKSGASAMQMTPLRSARTTHMASLPSCRKSEVGPNIVERRMERCTSRSMASSEPSFYRMWNKNQLVPSLFQSSFQKKTTKYHSRMQVFKVLERWNKNIPKRLFEEEQREWETWRRLYARV